MVRLFLFGSPRVERDGVTLPLRRTKGLALLAYLGGTGRSHGRDALATLLWPEFDGADARNNLRRELSLLRSTLGETALVADRQQVAWGGPPEHWVDVAAFAERVSDGRRAARAGGIDEAVAQALTEAVALAESELLEGYGLAESAAFEEWLFYQREELRQELAWALEALVGWHTGRGEVQRALSLARRWQLLDPLDEQPRRALMLLYAQAGQHAAALRLYEEGARLLEAEIGAEPEEATTTLYTAIRARSIAPAPRDPPPQPKGPPASAAAPQHAGPPLTSFIGRHAAIATLADRLRDPACRLLTLVGPGGSGKTRLAQEVAARCGESFADGAAFVPLVGTTAAAQIPAAVAAALDLPLAGAGAGWEALAGVLRGREQLLVLDNVEQLLDAAPHLAALLHAAPRLTLLATSREALGLQAEWLWPVAGLDVPADDSAPAEAAEAVQLFVARAQQRRGAFDLGAEREAVVQICRLVGGLPLAIELAAAWTPTLSCAEIAAEIAGGTALLSTALHHVPERHRSIQSLLDQAWARLDAPLRQVLARLALFPAGVTREAAAAVANASAHDLARLIERALLRRDEDGRYQLHPLVRHDAEQRLRASPEEAAAAQAVCSRYYADFLRAQFARQLGGEQLAATLAIRAERENIRSVLPTILEQLEGEPLRQALHALHDFYFTCGPYQEGIDTLNLAAARLRAAGGAPQSQIVLAHVLGILGLFCIRTGDVTAARAYLHEAQALFEALGAPPLLGDGTDPEIGLGVLALIAGDYRAASRHGERVRSRSAPAGLKHNLAYGWYLAAEAAQAQGLLAAAHTAARRALAVAHEARAEWLSAYVRLQLGQIAAARGRYDEADAHFRASHAIREAFGDREGMALALLGQGGAAAERGDVAGAAERYGASLALYRQIGDRGGAARALLGLGRLAVTQGDLAAAWRQLRAALAQARDLGYHHVAIDGLVEAAAALLAGGQPSEAPALLALVLVHPASRHAAGLRAQQLLAQCEALLPPADFAAAVARGRAASLDALVDALVAMDETTTAPLQA